MVCGVRSCLRLIAALLISLFAAWPLSASAMPRSPLSAPDHQVRLIQRVPIPMRDGLKLFADVLMPDGKGPFPTVLVRTPYGRQGPGDWLQRGRFFAARGYVVVVQSVRGRQDSEGQWQPWMNERSDGYDTVDWISRQTWSDGSVGMIGASYMGSAQLQAAAEAHPALKCIIPIGAGTDPFFQVPFDHGIFHLELLQWLHAVSNPARTLDDAAPAGARPSSAAPA
jgi:uncharacterized protein